MAAKRFMCLAFNFMETTNVCHFYWKWNLPIYDQILYETSIPPYVFMA